MVELTTIRTYMRGYEGNDVLENCIGDNEESGFGEVADGDTSFFFFFILQERIRVIFMSTFYGYVKRCVQCNAEFKTSAHNRKFCSDECRVACVLAKREALKIDPYADWKPEFAEPDSMKRLREIAIAATKEGVSYGQYMANHQTKKKGKR